MIDRKIVILLVDLATATYVALVALAASVELAIHFRVQIHGVTWALVFLLYMLLFWSTILV
jgi:hypothetical protein